MNEVSNKKMNWYYFRQKDGNENRPICQYMRLDYLIRLLETRQYYVSRRYKFQDANENLKNRALLFGVSPAKVDERMKQETIERSLSYYDIITCPTSCWSLNEEENFLMWKSYATEMGACIRTTVHDLIASLEIDIVPEGDNKVLCGTMDYKKFHPSTDEEQQLFDKDKAYSGEKEFRFYFMLESDNDKKSNGIYIPINTSVFVGEILLSPFINKDAADKFKRMIKCSYGIENVRLSEIKIKK